MLLAKHETFQSLGSLNNTDMPSSANNTTKMSQPQLRERQIAIGSIVAASVGLFACTAALIQAYITHKPAFELLGWNYSSFKPGAELLGYYSFIFLIAGYLALMMTASISMLVDTERKRLSYISASISVIFMLLSFGLLFISHQPRSEWWGYLSKVTLATGFITMTFGIIMGTQRKQLRVILHCLTILLMCVASVLLVLAVSSTDAIAASAAVTAQ